MSETGQSNHPNESLPQRVVSHDSVKTAVSSTEAQTNNFERQLFRNGTLDFNLEKYVEAANESLERNSQLYDPGSLSEIAVENFARHIQDAHYDLIWQQSFSGKIPRHWDRWSNVQDDFEKAREQN